MPIVYIFILPIPRCLTFGILANQSSEPCSPTSQMATLSDVTAVIAVSTRLYRYIKNAPIQYKETLQTLASLRRILKEVSKLLKNPTIHEEPSISLTDPCSVDSRNSNQIEELEDDDTLDEAGLDESVERAMLWHVHECMKLLREFETRELGWKAVTTTSATEETKKSSSWQSTLFGSVIQTHKTISACRGLSTRAMERLERQIRSHVDALNKYITIVTEDRVKKLNEVVRESGRVVGGKLDDMHVLMEKVHKATMCISTQVSSSATWGPAPDCINIIEPFGVFGNCSRLPMALCSSIYSICQVLAIAMRDTGIDKQLDLRACHELQEFKFYGAVLFSAKRSFKNFEMLQSTAVPAVELPDIQYDCEDEERSRSRPPNCLRYRWPIPKLEAGYTLRLSSWSLSLHLLLTGENFNSEQFRTGRERRSYGMHMHQRTEDGSTRPGYLVCSGRNPPSHTHLDDSGKMLPGEAQACDVLQDWYMEQFRSYFGDDSSIKEFKQKPLEDERHCDPLYCPLVQDWYDGFDPDQRVHFSSKFLLLNMRVFDRQGTDLGSYFLTPIRRDKVDECLWNSQLQRRMTDYPTLIA
ncbi:hypothetical protein BJ508DRAFT_110907 [Ascobolus immersus RN42]|uniref:Fungal N-terminal domain-containing protein n=1 Tax=Ascobolus immersus RN42 TaxID=1160509 RepID=A0A3N4IA25_ASCIM|nr:hypothetical protein BJ508DRAFT_110907 [Ascobolus immersus RN42]